MRGSSHTPIGTHSFAVTPSANETTDSNDMTHSPGVIPTELTPRAQSVTMISHSQLPPTLKLTKLT